MLAKCKLDKSETIWPCEFETCPYFGQCDSEWKAELYRQPTNADRIRAMSDEELADFLCSVAYAGDTPWSDLVARKFCDNCPTVEGTVQETGKTMVFYECDFSDGKCPHGSDVVWWLRQPAPPAEVDL